MLKYYLRKIFNARIIATLFFGFSAGIPLALTGSALTMWLSRLGLNVTTIGLFALIALPFSFKYLWSPLFDNVAIPLLTKRLGLRRSWLLVAQIILMITIIALGQSSPLHNIQLTAFVALMVSFFSASQDILIDALRIELLEEEEQALGASMYVYGYRIAMLVSGAGSLLLAEHFAWSFVYLMMSFGIVVGIVATIAIKEPECSKKHLENMPNFLYLIKRGLKLALSFEMLALLLYIFLLPEVLDFVCKTLFIPEKFKNFIGVLVTIIMLGLFKNKFKSVIPESILEFANRPQWIYILLFVVFYKLADTLLDSLKTKFFVDAGFSNVEIAYITKGLGFIMTLAGLFVGGLVYYRLKTFNSLVFSGVLQIVSNLLFIWVAKSHHDLLALSVAIAIENFTGSINTVVVIAYLSNLCNLNYTATQYALLSSIANIGRTIISAPAGYIVASVGWVNFIWITALAGIPSIYILFKIKDTIHAREKHAS